MGWVRGDAQMRTSTFGWHLKADVYLRCVGLDLLKRGGSIIGVRTPKESIPGSMSLKVTAVSLMRDRRGPADWRTRWTRAAST